MNFFLRVIDAPVRSCPYVDRQVRPIAAGPPGSTIHWAWRWIRAAAPSSWPTTGSATRCVGCPPVEVREKRRKGQKRTAWRRRRPGRGNERRQAQRKSRGEEMSPKARLFSSNLAETGVKLRDAATSDLDERTETLERRGQRRKDEKAAAVSRARKKEFRDTGNERLHP